MNKGNYRVESNELICTRDGSNALLSVWKMILSGDTSHITAPGQFVNIAVPGKFLRRPISICDWDESTITIVYRIVGEGTFDLSRIRKGETLDMLCGLGNGFSTEGCSKPLLVGGGVGLPPMLGLAKSFIKKNISPTVVAGFNTGEEVMLEKEFLSAGIELKIATMDGSKGLKGTVMEQIKNLEFDKFLACGPKPMLKALTDLQVPGELSVEERMGCGFGVCMGCSCKTRSGMKRVCKEGPVFKKEDLIW